MDNEITIEDIKKVQQELKKYQKKWVPIIAKEMDVSEHRVYGILYNRVKNKEDRNNFMIAARKIMNAYKKKEDIAVVARKEILNDAKNSIS